MALKVRPVAIGDVEQLVKLVRDMSNESEYYRARGFHEERTRRLVTGFCEWRENHLGYVTQKEDGELVGMIGLLIIDSLTHDFRFATDVGVFIRPEYRGNMASIRMIRAAETLAKMNDVHEIHLGISTGVHPEKTVHMYERLGYKLASYGMIKEL